MNILLIGVVVLIAVAIIMTMSAMVIAIIHLWAVAMLIVAVVTFFLFGVLDDAMTTLMTSFVVLFIAGGAAIWFLPASGALLMVEVTATVIAGIVAAILAFSVAR